MAGNERDSLGELRLAFRCKLVVESGAHDRHFCPVTAYIPVSYKNCSNLEVVDSKSKRRVPCQVSKKRHGVTLSWLVTNWKAGTKQTLLAKNRAAHAAAPRVRVDNRNDEARVDISVHGKPFTTYHYGRERVRPFLHPLIGPKGARVTRNWPGDRTTKGEHRDHRHHKSIWVDYGACGKVDHWSEDPGHGWQRHQQFLNLSWGPVFGAIRARNAWCYPNGRKQFEELRELRVYALRGGTRLFDLDVTFKMTQGPVTFKDTKEVGLVSIRAGRAMELRHGGRIENAYGGVNERETWGKPAPWCDYSGMADGVHVGLAVLDHESNPRYPTAWQVRDYGLMTANCFAESHYRPALGLKGDMRFRKGQQRTWRYRLYIHPGDARQGRVSQRFLDYVSPPAVTVT